MVHSIQSRPHSISFNNRQREYVLEGMKYDTMTTKPRLSLVIDSSVDRNNLLTPSPHSSVRQKFYSLFKSQSPVMSTLRESIQHIVKPTSDISTHENENFGKMEIENTFIKQDPYLEDDTSSNSSSNNSVLSSDFDQMIVLPNVCNDDGNRIKSDQTIPSIYPNEQTTSPLAYEIQKILGSAIDEVDKEIEQSWEDSRRVLRTSIRSSLSNQYKIISI